MEVRLAHRLGLIESLLIRIDAKVDALDTKLTAKIDALDAKLDSKIDAKADSLRSDLMRLHYVVVGGWLTLMIAIFARR